MTECGEYERLHMRIYDSLPIGEQNAIPGATLAEMHDIDPRQLREAVEKERAAGALICSSNKGYFRGNRKEIEATYNILRKRALGTLATIKPFADYLGRGEDPLNEQLTLADFMDMNP